MGYICSRQELRKNKELSKGIGHHMILHERQKVHQDNFTVYDVYCRQHAFLCVFFYIFKMLEGHRVAAKYTLI